MKHEESFLKGVRGTKIYSQKWLPEHETKAILLVIHGLAEHSGRYANVVNYFVPLGYAVYALDHIGHGKSEGTRVYVERFEDFTDTIKIYFDMIRESHPDTPIFLVGHSMGALIGAFYLLDHQDELAGSVLSGASVKIPEDISPAIILVGKILSVLAPKMGLIQLEADGVSRDPEVVAAYVNDPLVTIGKYTTRLAAELLRAMKRVTTQASTIHLPLLLLQGSADTIVDPTGAQMLYDTVSSEDKTLKMYEGLYHEVFNEPERAQVLQDMEKWLDRQS
ncbi:MAG: alpha/beta hydrolase [Anaerolineaceae bacterium 4572_5.1]|nr:MAG: alpha/beta hydrolase [Anaerolineaceae bacterium 4572_5.1]RLD11013.1 MAG: alpha/beta hydrolase [Chloroflexota bacterium]